MPLPDWLAAPSNPLGALPRLPWDAWRDSLRGRLGSMPARLATLGSLLADSPLADIVPAEVDCANTRAALGLAATSLPRRSG